MQISDRRLIGHCFTLAYAFAALLSYNRFAVAGADEAKNAALLALNEGTCAASNLHCRPDRTWFGTLYVDRLALGDLRDIPGKIFDGNLWDHHQYFIGGALSYVIVHDLHIPIPFVKWTATHNRIEVEGQFDRHFGTARYTEGVVAAVFRTGDIPLWAGTKMNFAVKDGASFLFSTPVAVNGESRNRLLNYLAAEIEFGSDQFPGLYVVPQFHHRSSIFGLTAPKGSGSTFLGIGIRIDLD